MVLVIGITFGLLIIVDLKLSPILTNYVDLEANKVLTYVVNRSIQSLDYDASSFVIVQRNKNDEIERITYNTGVINDFKSLFIMSVEEKIRNLESGVFYDDYFVSQKNERKKFPKIKQGYLCEINYNSIRSSVLFGNVGPSIPIKLSFLGYFDVDVDVIIREYGINNTLVEIDVVVDASSIVTMPVSSKKHHSSIREPISVEIIHGQIPNYYLEHTS